MPRSVALGCLSLLAFPVCAQAARPAELPTLTRTLVAPAAARHDCATTGARRGVTRSRYVAPMSGFVTARLGSARGDWDLVARDAASRRDLATSQSFGSNEVVQTWARAGQRIDFVACRRTGNDRSARLRIAFVDVAPPAVQPTVSLVRVRGADDKIQALENAGLDVTHERGMGFADVLVAGDAQRRLLAASGLDTTTRVTDMAAYARASDRADARRAALGRSALPSGRQTYRDYSDVQTELKALVEKHPDTVRPVVIGKTFQGRDIEGVEIADNVKADDGRPVFFLMGLHHAREWPSEEAAMEYATMLADPSADARVAALRANERTVIVPVVNVDGFVSTRQDGAVDPNDNNPAGQDPNVELGEAVAPPGGILAYRRKNCDGQFPDPNVPCELQWGIDNNRNYGNLWGGPGSSQDPTSQSFHGPGPRSEPETQAVWNFARTHQVTFLMTLHNVAALVLRPPGLHDGGKAPDEARMKQIGDAMGAATGYTSQYSFELYDTAGTTEDDTYSATGGYGYTIEMGPKDGMFHMPYQQGVIDQWEHGDAPAGSGGLREALLIAGEAAANPADHAIISGGAPAGATLRLKRDFDTKTSKFCPMGVDPVVTVAALPDALACPGGWQDPQTLHDSLDSTTVVPASGTFSWHVNQSTRPFVGGGAVIEKLSDTSSRTDTFTGGGAANSTPGSGTEDRDFTITPEDNASAVKVDVSWGTPEDYDLEVYRKNADGSLTQVGTSGNSPGQAEEVVLEGDKATPGNYVLRVVNFAAAVGTWTATVGRYQTTQTVTTGSPEPYTMTCEVSGQVVRSTQVFIGRGQTLGVNPCSAATPAVVYGSSTEPAKAKPKPKPRKTPSCKAKAERKHGKARKRALRHCRAVAHKKAKRRHT
jgi:Zinc carboxypeptidase